jgi:glutamine phosphoribosylpyrophosphate amidotransferase
MCFLCKLAREAQLTNEMRARKIMASDDHCLVCKTDTESLLHAFGDCSKAAAIWTAIAENPDSKFYQ